MAAAALAIMGGAAYAGPHAGGTLILHASGIVPSFDPTPYCGQSGLVDCDQARNTVPGGDASSSVVAHVLAAFATGSSPALTGVVFGIGYDPNFVTINYYSHCGDFALPSDGPNGAWPSDGSGLAVTWNTAQTSLLTEVANFSAYGYGQDCSSLNLGLHPTQGGSFADDDTPANLDDIAGFGSLGFNCPGHTPCPELTVVGACCPPNFAPCVIATEDECLAGGGVYQGDGSVCGPDTCPEPPPTGACCIGDVCSITTAADCQGTYQGDGTGCDPNPCIIIPTETTTWGAIKNTYR
jgi:hypothetical protein